MFTLMWCFPFMVYGLGLSPNTAALMLVVTVVVGSVAGPSLGLFSARFPHLRIRGILLGAGALGMTRILKRSEEHTSELQSRGQLVCRLLLENKNKRHHTYQ